MRSFFGGASSIFTLKNYTPLLDIPELIYRTFPSFAQAEIHFFCNFPSICSFAHSTNMVRGYVPCDIPAYSPTPSAASSAIGTPATANPDARETHGRNSDSFVHVDRAEPGPPDATGENANGTQQTEPASKPLSSTVIHKSSELFKWISPYLAHASVWIIIFLLPLHILKSSYCSITTGCGGAISRGHERRIDVSVAPVVSRWGDSEGSRAVHQIRVQVETAEEVFKSVFDFGNRVEHQITVDWPHIQ